MKSNRVYLRQINYRTFKKYNKAMGNYGSCFSFSEWEEVCKEVLSLKVGDKIWNHWISNYSVITEVEINWVSVASYRQHYWSGRGVSGEILDTFIIHTDSQHNLYDTPSWAERFK